jgi:hypothetical protein
VKRQTVSEIHHSKGKLEYFSLAYSVDASTWGAALGERKHVKVAVIKN